MESTQINNWFKPVLIWISFKYIFAKKQNRFIAFNALLAIIGISLAIASLIIVTAVMDGFKEDLEEKIIGTSAHIRIDKYKGEDDPQSIISKIKKNPNVKSITPFVEENVILNIQDKKDLILLQGIDPINEVKVTNIKRYLISGNFLNKPNTLIIGKELAAENDLSIGEMLNITSMRTYNSKAFEIAGIFSTGVYLLDSKVIYTQIKSAQTLLEMNEKVSGFKISLYDHFKVKQVNYDLSMMFDVRYFFSTWIDQNKNLIAVLQTEKRIMLIILSIIIILSGLNISTTLMMNVMQKKRDIGVLMSIGFSKDNIRQIFLMQGILMCIIGLIFGLSSGILISLNIDAIFHVFEVVFNFELFPKDIYSFSKIPINLKLSNIVYISLFSIFITLISAIYPARKAASLDPVEVLKNE